MINNFKIKKTLVFSFNLVFLKELELIILIMCYHQIESLILGQVMEELVTIKIIIQLLAQDPIEIYLIFILLDRKDQILVILLIVKKEIVLDRKGNL